VSLLIVPFCSHAGKPNFPQLLEKNGGDDETRTRDLCRDRVAVCWNLVKLNGADSPSSES